MNPLVQAMARRLHRLAPLRRIAKHVARGRTVTQPFHGGVICLDAVEHSWAWTGERTLETFDLPLQDRLSELTSDRPVLLDLGCSIGVMTLSVLLRNPRVQVLALDPNPRAIALLNESIRLNRLESRVKVQAFAISSGESSLRFNTEGSFTGHVSASGPAVPATPITAVLQELGDGPLVVKIDLEGYEAVLAGTFGRIQPPRGSVFVIELHPIGFNGMGDPEAVVAAFRKRGDAGVSLLGGAAVGGLDPRQFQQLEVHW